MNYLQKILCVAGALLCSVQMYAYTFKVVNHTNREQHISIRLKGFAEQVEYFGVTQPNGGFVERTFGGLRIGLCVEHLVVGNYARRVFEVSDEQYAAIIAREKSPAELAHYINMHMTRFIYASSSPVGVCFSRQFDLFEVNGELIVITRPS